MNARVLDEEIAQKIYVGTSENDLLALTGPATVRSQCGENCVQLNYSRAYLWNFFIVQLHNGKVVSAYNDD